MTLLSQFLTMTFVSSQLITDRAGNLFRVEKRRDERTGLVLTNTTPIPAR